MSDAFIFGALGGLLAVMAEFTMKRWGTTYWHTAWLTLPLAFAVNYCIYRLVRGSPSLPAAIIIFATTTLCLRIVLSLWIGNPIGKGTWMACGLMLIASWLRHWRP